MLVDKNDYCEEILERDQSERALNLILNRFPQSQTALMLLALSGKNNVELARMFSRSSYYISDALKKLRSRLCYFETDIKNVCCGQYEVRLDDVYYRMKIMLPYGMAEKMFDEIRDIVKGAEFGERHIIKRGDEVEIVAVRDKAFFDLAEKVDRLVRKNQEFEYLKKIVTS